MFPRLAPLLSLAAALFAPLAHADDAREQAPRAADQCAQVTASVRMEAYGYTHVVALKNGCDKPVVCEVWTDVDPTPRHTLRAAPGATESVITRRGSPARELKADKVCKYQAQ